MSASSTASVDDQVCKALLTVAAILAFIWGISIAGEKTNEYNQCHESGRLPVYANLEVRCLPKPTNPPNTIESTT